MSMTTVTVKSNYASLLQNNKILYVPSCLIIEMITRLYSQVSRQDLSGDVHAVFSDILILVRRMSLNLRATSEAYAVSRIKFFVGDWREDKVQARKVFFNLVSRLTLLTQRVTPVEKRLLFEALEELGREWEMLDTIMERKCEESRFNNSGGTCRYFRSLHPENWQQSMANILLNLSNEEQEVEPGSYLLLLCYTRIKALLLKEAETIQRKTSLAKSKFSGDRILCVSCEDVSVTCPNCMKMTKSASGSNYTGIIRRGGTVSTVASNTFKRIRDANTTQMIGQR